MNKLNNSKDKQSNDVIFTKIFCFFDIKDKFSKKTIV